MEWLQSLDIQLLLWLREVCQTPILNQPMIWISALGNCGAIWLAIALIFILLGNRKNPWRRWGVTLLLCLGGCALVCNLILKPWVGRIRPYDLLGFQLLIPPLSDFSFPSGHTSASFAAAATLCTMNKRWGVAALIFGGLMGFSRLYLGVHFPSDVFMGALIGWFVAKFVIYLQMKWDKSHGGGVGLR